MNIIEAMKAALGGKGIKRKTSLGFFAFSEESGIKDLYFFRPQHLYALPNKEQARFIVNDILADDWEIVEAAQ
ncbi:MAG: hypothetical protein H6911_05490 [Rickettsiaceae bacterium]|nr:hypothetical protein [Rickettsiaceae bacterium]MCP5463321.1 hypothetical protein [bacterium]